VSSHHCGGPLATIEARIVGRMYDNTKLGLGNLPDSDHFLQQKKCSSLVAAYRVSRVSEERQYVMKKTKEDKPGQT